MDEPELTLPLRVPVTTAWLEEMRRRQATYAERRARWREALRRNGEPEPPTDTDPAGRGRGRTIHDPRQFRFDF